MNSLIVCQIRKRAFLRPKILGNVGDTNFSSIFLQKNRAPAVKLLENGVTIFPPGSREDPFEKHVRHISVHVDFRADKAYILTMYGMYPYTVSGKQMATTRFDMRLDEKVKAKAEKASALLGMKSLTEYVVRLMDENATQVISEHESMVLEEDIFDRFLTACEEANRPNQALLDAAKLTKELGIR